MALSVDYGLPYVELRWQLSDSQVESIVLSNFITLEGIKTVRLGIQNLEGQRCTLSLFAHQLHQTGIEFENVTCRIDGLEWINMTRHGCQSTILFTAVHSTTLRGPHILTFRAPIITLIDNYCSVLRDCTLGTQLWSATGKEGAYTDLDIRVETKSFSAHKSLVAVRSSILATQIEQHNNSTIDCPINGKTRIIVPDMDSHTFEELLKYMYTGKLEFPVKNPDEFRKAASTYGLLTLSELCKMSLQESLKPVDLIELLGSLEVTPSKQPLPVSVCVMEEAKRCHTGFVVRHKDTILSNGAQGRFKFQNETTFGWRFSKNSEEMSSNICLFSSLCLKSDLYVYDVICRYQDDIVTMVERNRDEDCIVQIFDAQIISKNSSDICFEVFIRSRVETVTMELTDFLGSKELWQAAQQRKWTDVEFQVGEQSYFAHQWLVSARSPVFAALFSDLLLEEAASCDVPSSSSNPSVEKSSTTSNKTTVIKIENIEANIFQVLLVYLYTGTLKVAASKELLAAAEKYQVETLSSLCRVALREVDCEKLSFKLLSY